MIRLREHRWLILAAVLVVVLLEALSMHMERMVGWRFLILCLVVGSLGGLGFLWARDRLLLSWSPLSKSRKRLIIAALIVLYLIGTFVTNHQKPDEGFHDAMECLAVLGALLLWGLYRIMSRFLDGVHERFFKR